MPTRAIQFLKQKKIPFEVVRYDHAEKGAKFAALWSWIWGKSIIAWF